MTRRMHGGAACAALVVLLGMAGAFIGCTAGGSGGSAGSGGHAGTGGIAPHGGGGAGGIGIAGVGGTVAGGAGAGGIGTGAMAGQPTGGAGAGGIGAGGMGAGGIGAGGTGGMDAGVCPAGQMWCPGCTSGSGTCASACPGFACPAPDADCLGPLCSQDADSSPDLSVSCSQIRTQAECDQRSDCHSVSYGQQPCTCTTPGCCQRFDYCVDGGTTPCSGTITCTSPTQYCEPPYVPQYSNGCYWGCVLTSKCAQPGVCPQAAPSNGASCGSEAFSCAYQDCSGAGRTQADCQGGIWNVQTVPCATWLCPGGGTYSGGDMICVPGQICVRTTGGGGAYIITPSCIPNTCSPSPVSLDCLLNLGLSGSCSVQSQSEIDCQAPSLCGSGEGGCQ